jgi:lipopolysaccharide export system protein LptA
VLTLTGAGTVADYQAALRSVTFASTAAAGVKTVSIIVTADAVDSLPGVIAVTVAALPIATNVPPLVTTSGVRTYTAGSSPVTLDPLVAVIDVDSPNLTGATVSVGAGFVSGTDTLGYTQGASTIAGTYNSATGVLTLSGNATVAQYQAALRSVTFSTSSSALAAIKTVSVVVTDGITPSVPGTVAVTVIALPVNVPPLVVTSGVRTYTAGSAAATLDPSMTVIDLDSPTLTGATLTIASGFVSGTDALGYTQGASPIAGFYNSSTGVLTLTGTGTAVQYQAALQSVTFSTSSSALAAIKTVSVVATDGTTPSVPGTVAVTVIASPVNVPPLVVTSLANVSYTAGSSATTLDPAVTVTDVDSANLTGATVTITAGMATGDTLGFTAANGITGSYNATTGVLTLTGTTTVANYQQALRSVTFATSASAVAAIKTMSIAVTDTQAAQSLPGLVAVTVLSLPVNLPPVVVSSLANTVPFTAGNAPAVLDGAVTILEDSASLSGATVSIGLGRQSGDTLAFTSANGITGSYNATTGVLTLSGTATVAQYQTALRSVTFATPTAGLLGVRTISMAVTDGLGLSSASVPLTVTVVANTEPVVTTSVVGNLLYKVNATPKVLDPLIIVADDSTSLSSATITITVGKFSGDMLAFTQPVGSSITGSYNSTSGTLTLTGAGTVAQYQEALRSVTFATSSLGILARTASFVVTDIQGLQSVSLPLVIVVSL